MTPTDGLAAALVVELPPLDLLEQAVKDSATAVTAEMARIPLRIAGSFRVLDGACGGLGVSPVTVGLLLPARPKSFVVSGNVLRAKSGVQGLLRVKFVEASNNYVTRP